MTTLSWWWSLPLGLALLLALAAIPAERWLRAETTEVETVTRALAAQRRTVDGEHSEPQLDRT